MNKIYHYTSFETFKKIIESGTIRFNCLKNMDDMTEGILWDTQNQSAYNFVSCWTKNSKENIPLWQMYAPDAFSIRIGIVTDFIEPDYFDDCFLLNHTNRQAYVFVNHRGEGRGFEFLSEVKYCEISKMCMTKNLRSIINPDYAKYYGLVKSESWAFQEEVRFHVSAVLKKSLRPRKKESLFILCFESIINNDYTDIEYIDIKYNKEKMLNVDIMLGPQTTKEHKSELLIYLKKYLPKFRGTISRSENYIKSK